MKLIAALFYFVEFYIDLHSRVSYIESGTCLEIERQSALTIPLVTLLEYAVPTCVPASARAYYRDVVLVEGIERPSVRMKR